MFRKQIRVKSKTVMKNSDRRDLRTKISRQIPLLSDEQVNQLIPKKDDVSLMKIFTHAGDSVSVYCLEQNPVFFEHNNIIFPTVYTLWKCRDVVLTLTTLPSVLSKISNGADLMLPGILQRDETLPHFAKNMTCAINLTDNQAAVAVGSTAVSSGEAQLNAMKGKGVIVLHTYMDQLWACGNKLSLPQFQPMISAVCLDRLNTDEYPPLGGMAITTATKTPQPQPQPVCEPEPQEEEEEEEGEGEGAACAEIEEVEMTPADMDNLFRKCFLISLKASVKKADLPVIASKFFRSNMVPVCPPDQHLDVKKSTYKKFSKFLAAMKSEQFIAVKELSKGVESITDINWAHPQLRGVHVEDIEMPIEPVDTQPVSLSDLSCYVPPLIEEMYCINAGTLPLFAGAGFTKSQPLYAKDVRTALTSYIKKNDLFNVKDPNLILVNGPVCDALLNKGERHSITQLTRSDMLQRCMSKMSCAHRITYPGMPPTMKKGALQCIEMKVERRGGNKKVTLISNLEGFGLDADAVAHRIQLGVQSSTTVSPLPGKTAGSQVMVQGNQITFVGKMLTDDLKLPKKYIMFMDKTAPKPQPPQKKK